MPGRKPHSRSSKNVFFFECSNDDSTKKITIRKLSCYSKRIESESMTECIITTVDLFIINFNRNPFHLMIWLSIITYQLRMGQKLHNFIEYISIKQYVKLKRKQPFCQRKKKKLAKAGTCPNVNSNLKIVAATAAENHQK